MKPGEFEECSCEICVRMCERRPCWATPDEILEIIDKGFGDKLMIDYWANDEQIDIVSPAIVGYESQYAPWWPNGRCTFLDKDNLCILHKNGVKPQEGAVADCKNKKQSTIHKDVALLWDNDKGRSVVKMFKEKFVK